MNNSNEPSATRASKRSKTDLELEFPIDPDWISELPRVDFQAMLRRIKESMPYRSTRPGEAQRRWENRVDVEFIL